MVRGDANDKENAERELTAEDLMPRSKSRAAANTGAGGSKSAKMRVSLPGKSMLAGKGGARRVPIGSADAAPSGPYWR